MKVNGLEYPEENIESMNRSYINEIIEDIKILVQTGRLKRRSALAIIAELNVDDEIFEEVAELSVNLES